MSKTNLKHQIPRAALTLLLMLTLSLTASASIAFITDVMVAGHNSQSQFTELIDTLQQQGWIDIEQDLNAGAGGDYIHLLLKTRFLPSLWTDDISRPDASDWNSCIL